MKNEAKTAIDAMFSAGSHFGLGRSRRHPTVAKYIFGTKNRTDIFDLEKTDELLSKAKEFMNKLGKEGKTVLIVGGKKEACQAVKTTAQNLNMPYVDGRWIGGSLTNFGNIRKRIERFESLVSDKEKGELAKYTKRERMLLDKEIAKLEKMFLGIVPMKKLPDALVVIDPKYEDIAIREADNIGIPVVALANSDCDISKVKYPIVGNDATKSSISYFLGELANAFSAK